MIAKTDNDWREYLRLVTPTFVFLFGIIGFLFNWGILNKIDTIDDKLFKHLTNDEMHTPRSIAVTKPEFLIYQSMRDQQMQDLKEVVYDIHNLIKKDN